MFIVFVLPGLAQQKESLGQELFKSILKLDKNFHIYIHGNSELIRRGEEKDGRKFYKIYFENEA